MSSNSVTLAGLVNNVSRLSFWPHRVAGLLSIVISLNALYRQHLGYIGETLVIPLLPYAFLEAVGHIPSTRGTKLLFFGGSLCLCACIVFYAPIFWRGSGEWTRLAFLLIPALQAAGVIVLGLLLIILRLLASRL